MQNKSFQMNKISLFFIGFYLLICTSTIKAQSLPEQDIMRSNGKIFVVMGVVVIILIGLFTYVNSIDRKITRLEKENLQK